MSDDIRMSGGDTYGPLHGGFTLDGDPAPAAEDPDVRNSGEIYFSANNGGRPYDWSRYEQPAGGASAARRQRAAPGAASGSGQPRSQSGAQRQRARETQAYRPSDKKRASASGKKSRSSGSDRSGLPGYAVAAIVIVVVVIASFLIRIPIIGCIGDITAMNRDTADVKVTVSANMTTNDVIDLLKEQDLIYSAKFCKMIYKFLGHDENEIYPEGTFTVSASMGLEGMMREIITAGATDSTVTITFPEGFTVDQIIQKLASNGVASSSALYAIVDDPVFIEEFDFLQNVDRRDERYHYLEGYLYPDTYEFYIGESPQSVIERFLKNFSEKWNKEFSDRLEKSSYSMDEILIVASILEKEAKDADQMPLVASVIYNRLSSSSFPNIQCDSTKKFIDNNKEKLVADGRYAALLKVYDTYQATGLPVGPIGNPGYNAISAALSPEITDYYYFIHDAMGQIYLASDAEEHQQNIIDAGIE